MDKSHFMGLVCLLGGLLGLLKRIKFPRPQPDHHSFNLRLLFASSILSVIGIVLLLGYGKWK